MTTLYALLCQACGLSLREAADFLDVRQDTGKSWSAGRNPTPDGVLGQLAGLAARIETAADETVAALADSGAGPGNTVEIGLAVDDAEARSIGWPCVGAHRAVVALAAARAMARGYRVTIVPRGATPATAAAADAHGL